MTETGIAHAFLRNNNPAAAFESQPTNAASCAPMIISQNKLTSELSTVTV